MKWTTEPPKTGGWYWIRSPRSKSSDEWMIVCVTPCEGCDCGRILYYNPNHSMWIPVEAEIQIGAEWSTGPVPLPEGIEDKMPLPDLTEEH